MTFKLKNGGESIMTKHTKKGGSHNKQNSKILEFCLLWLPPFFVCLVIIDSPPFFSLNVIRSSIACSRGTDFHQEAFYVYVKAR